MPHDLLSLSAPRWADYAWQHDYLRDEYMKHRLRKMLLTVIQDSPFETPLRQCYGLLSRDRGSRYDRETLKVMKRVLCKDSNCIDVGAYRGEILRHMLKLAPSGKVIAIEPVAENCQYLSRKYGDAEIHNIALSDVEGEAGFYHVIGRPARSGLRRQAYPDPDEDIKIITVPVKRLDSTIPEAMKIDFIKIDVEGAELLVLRGAENLIRMSKPVIVFEHGVAPARQFGTSTGQIFDLLAGQYGMHVSTMKRWLENDAPYTRNEFEEKARSMEEFYFIGYS